MRTAKTVVLGLVLCAPMVIGGCEPPAERDEGSTRDEMYGGEAGDPTGPDGNNPADDGAPRGSGGRGWGPTEEQGAPAAPRGVVGGMI